MTGEQGGKLLACYLHSLEEDDAIFTPPTRPQEDAILTPQAWLEKQQPRFLLYPAQKACIKEALKFYPELVAGLKKYEQFTSANEG